jgi:hypothetical protein
MLQSCQQFAVAFKGVNNWAQGNKNFSLDHAERTVHALNISLIYIWDIGTIKSITKLYKCAELPCSRIIPLENNSVYLKFRRNFPPS